MKKIVIKFGKIILNIIYFFLKLMPVKKQVIFVCMQSNKPSLDFNLLAEEIKRKDEDIKLVFLCKKMDSNLSNVIDYIKYVFNTAGYVLKVMCYLAISKVCITESYCVPISLLKHKKELKVIQIWHASGAVKKFGYQALDTKEGKTK